MAGAAIVAGLAGLVIMIVTASVLDPVSNAEFMVFWSLLFWVVGALAGIQVETVRSVRQAALVAADGGGGARGVRTRGVRVVPWGLGCGLAVAAAVAGVGWFVDRPAFAGSAGVSAAALIVGAGLFGGQAAFAGAAGGCGRWRWAGVMLAGEALVRLAGFAIVLALIDGERFVPFKVATAAGSLILLVGLWPGSGARLALRARGDAAPAGYLRRTGPAVLANAASSSLINGFPALMSLTMDAGTVRGAAGLMFAVTMVRAPFLVLINAFAPMLVARLVGAGRRAGRLVAVGAVGLAAVAGIGALVVAIVGPWLLGYLRPAYQIGGPVLAALTAGAACLSAVTLSGSWALARGQHGAYLAGWLAALAVAAGVLAGPFSATVAVIVSLVAGPLVGAAVHIALITRHHRRAHG
ncbi:MAG: hypothetical protein LBK59_06760 [Bifidobacteriaceae bacterium]|jgi:hypothetical protein|nr:hypothetical protein [Bifidobacteriaceae bacterium]